MPYSTAYPPTLRHSDIGNRGPAEWAYDNTDAPAVVAAAGYISNARDLGMKVGDLMRYRQSSTNLITTFVLASISAAGAGDFFDGTSLPVTNAG